MAGRDRGAVLGRDALHVPHQPPAAGARHVLHDDIGIAWNVAAPVPRQHAGIGVVGTAGGRADKDRDVLALEIVVGCRIERAGTKERGRQAAGGESGPAPHRVPPCQQQLQKLLGVLVVDLVLLLGREPELVDQVDALLLEHEQRRRVGAEQEMIDADGVDRAARAGRMIAGRFQIHHLQVMQRLVLDQHRLVGAEEERLVLQAIGIVHAPDHLADAAAEMGADELQLREFLEHAAHDQPRDRERAVHRTPDARRQAIVAHPLLAEADRRRMDDHRHVELLRQLKERHRLVVVGIFALQARGDPGALQPVLLDGALELAQEFVAAIGHGRSHADDLPVILVLALGVEAVLALAALELLLRDPCRADCGSDC